MNHPAPGAVLLISFGGPTNQEEIRPFLDVVLRGHPVPPERVEQVVEQYRAIGGRSPITALTQAQADGLQEALGRAGRALPVYVGMRNWHPFIKDTLARMASDGVQYAVGLILAPHRSAASVGRYTNAVEEARKELQGQAPHIEYVSPWHDHPLFIEAISARISEARERLPEADRPAAPWIFTAHSIPVVMAAASTYVQEITRTIELVTARAGSPRWRLAYQSRSGDPAVPWLEPDVREVIREEARNGARAALVVPVGFVSDHVEVLYDLDCGAAGVAAREGVAFSRAGTVGTHPAFIRMLADVVVRAISRS